MRTGIGEPQARAPPRCDWALRATASAAGFLDQDQATGSTPVTSARRMAAAAVLQASENLDNTTMIAVVDAAAHWLDQPEDEEYAYALLGAVTDGPPNCGHTASYWAQDRQRQMTDRILAASGP